MNETIEFAGTTVTGTLAAIGAYLSPTLLETRALHTEVEDALEALCLCERDEM